MTKAEKMRMEQLEKANKEMAEQVGKYKVMYERLIVENAELRRRK